MFSLHLSRVIYGNVVKKDFLFFFCLTYVIRASLVTQLVKSSPIMWDTWVRSLGWVIHWRRERLPTSVFWPGEFHGLYSPWGRKELDMTEQLSLMWLTNIKVILTNIKVINKTKLMTFNTWFGYFEFINSLLLGVMLIVLNEHLDFIAIKFTWSSCPRCIIYREISSMKLCKPLLTCLISDIIFSIHFTNLFFLPFFFTFCHCVFTTLEIIKNRILKMLLFSSIFNIKIAMQKFTNFYFLKCMLIWHLSQIISNYVKDKWVLLDPSYMKKKKKK